MGEWRVFQVGWTACTEVGMNPMCVRNRFTGFCFYSHSLGALFPGQGGDYGSLFLSCSRFSEKWYKIGVPESSWRAKWEKEKEAVVLHSFGGMHPAHVGSWHTSGETSWFCSSEVWEQPSVCARRETLSTSCFLVQHSQVARGQHICCPSSRICMACIFILFLGRFEEIDEGSGWSLSLQFSQESCTHTNRAGFTRAVKDSEASSCM